MVSATFLGLLAASATALAHGGDHLVPGDTRVERAAYPYQPRGIRRHASNRNSVSGMLPRDDILTDDGIVAQVKNYSDNMQAISMERYKILKIAEDRFQERLELPEEYSNVSIALQLISGAVAADKAAFDLARLNSTAHTLWDKAGTYSANEAEKLDEPHQKQIRDLVQEMVSVVTNVSASLSSIQGQAAERATQAADKVAWVLPGRKAHLAWKSSVPFNETVDRAGLVAAEARWRNTGTRLREFAASKLSKAACAVQIKNNTMAIKGHEKAASKMFSDSKSDLRDLEERIKETSSAMQGATGQAKSYLDEATEFLKSAQEIFDKIVREYGEATDCWFKALEGSEAQATKSTNKAETSSAKSTETHGTNAPNPEDVNSSQTSTSQSQAKTDTTLKPDEASKVTKTDATSTSDESPKTEVAKPVEKPKTEDDVKPDNTPEPQDVVNPSPTSKSQREVQPGATLKPEVAKPKETSEPDVAKPTSPTKSEGDKGQVPDSAETEEDECPVDDSETNTQSISTVTEHSVESHVLVTEGKQEPGVVSAAAGNDSRPLMGDEDECVDEATPDATIPSGTSTGTATTTPQTTESTDFEDECDDEPTPTAVTGETSAINATTSHQTTDSTVDEDECDDENTATPSAPGKATTADATAPHQTSGSADDEEVCEDEITTAPVPGTISSDDATATVTAPGPEATPNVGFATGTSDNQTTRTSTSKTSTDGPQTSQTPSVNDDDDEEDCVEDDADGEDRDSKQSPDAKDSKSSVETHETNVVNISTNVNVSMKVVIICDSTAQGSPCRRQPHNESQPQDGSHNKTTDKPTTQTQDVGYPKASTDGSQTGVVVVCTAVTVESVCVCQQNEEEPNTQTNVVLDCPSGSDSDCTVKKTYKAPKQHDATDDEGVSPVTPGSKSPETSEPAASSPSHGEHTTQSPASGNDGQQGDKPVPGATKVESSPESANKGPAGSGSGPSDAAPASNKAVGTESSPESAHQGTTGSGSSPADIAPGSNKAVDGPGSDVEPAGNGPALGPSPEAASGATGSNGEAGNATSPQTSTSSPNAPGSATQQGDDEDTSNPVPSASTMATAVNPSAPTQAAGTAGSNPPSTPDRPPVVVSGASHVGPFFSTLACAVLAVLLV